MDGVSFTVNAGETFGLVGESGCGKTSTGRSILQLVPVTSGQVLFQGTDLTKLSRKELRPLRKEMQIIFQDPFSSLNPRMTIGQMIEEPLMVHKIYPDKAARRKRVEELLDMVVCSRIPMIVILMNFLADSASALVLPVRCLWLPN